MINILDIIVLIILIWFAGHGLVYGLIRSVFNLVGVIAALFVATLWLPIVSNFLKNHLPLPETQIGFISFVLIFIAVVVGFRLSAKILHEGLKIVLLGWINRVGGLLFGFLKGALLASGLLWLIGLFPLSESIQKMQEDSVLSSRIKPVLPLVYDGIVTIFPSANNFEKKMQGTVEQIKTGVRISNDLQKLKKE